MASAPLSMKFKMDASGPIELFGSRLPRGLAPALKLGTGKAAIKLQDMMRDELDRLIYSTPEPSSYKRTRTLYRATYAARPGANHSRDHDAAKSGVDLAVRVEGSGGGGFVRVNGYVVDVDIGSWADYAWHVHEGHGYGHRVPKPFSKKPAAEANGILLEEIGSAIAASIHRPVK